MSVKPTIALARWADLAGSFVTDAPSGLRDTGFLDGTPADADIVNAEFKQLYLWDKWLDDGDCAFHNLSATGTLGVTGATTLTGALAANGGVTTTTVSAANADVSTNVTIHSQLIMSGVATYSGTLRYQTGTGTALSTGNNNNYTLLACAVVAITGTSGSPVLTGMVPVGDGHRVTLVNTGSVSWSIAHQSSSSSTLNRFILPGAATLTLAQDQMATFLYDGLSAGRWRLESKNF